MASLLCEEWPSVVGRMVGKIDLDALAAETNALLRRQGVPSAEALLRFALARGPGGLSLRDTAAWAHLAGVAELTDASLNDRLHNSCEFLAAVGSAMLKSKVPGADFRWPGRVLSISDGTCVSKPGGNHEKRTDDGVVHPIIGRSAQAEPLPRDKAARQVRLVAVVDPDIAIDIGIAGLVRVVLHPALGQFLHPGVRVALGRQDADLFPQRAHFRDAVQPDDPAESPGGKCRKPSGRRMRPRAMKPRSKRMCRAP